MFEKEVLVAPMFEPGIVIGPEGSQGGMTGLMKMTGIFLETVIRREIHAPPNHQTGAASSAKAAKNRMFI
jgi:hypothetical protein